MPELVIRDATGRVESVAYPELPALLLNELQKQHAAIRAQQAEIAARDARVSEFERLLAAVVERVADLEGRRAESGDGR